MSRKFEPGEQSDKERIVCPHCGHSRKADPCDGDADEDPQDDECEECGKEFVRYASFTITYHTRPKK